MQRQVSVTGQIRTVPTAELFLNELTSLRANNETSSEFLELVASIKANGLLHPLIVRYAKSGGKYEIVCGRRRYLACRRLGYEEFPCSILDLSDREALEYSIVENLQRKNLDPVEEAEAFKRYLVNFDRGGITRLGAKIGKSEEYVSHRLLLLGLPKEITNRISRRLLKPSVATELVWLKDPAKQLSLADLIASRNLTFRETRQAAKIIRENEVSAEEAVDEVVHNGNHETQLGDEDRMVSSNITSDPWISYGTPKLKNEESAFFKHAILIVRSCLSGLDMLIDKSQEEKVRNLLMRQRKSVHSILDEIISTSLQCRQ